MIVQIEEQGELRDSFFESVRTRPNVVVGIEINRNMFRVHYREKKLLGNWRYWFLYKELHEVVKKHYPEALL